jgi:hypothetical protein
MFFFVSYILGPRITSCYGTKPWVFRYMIINNMFYYIVLIYVIYSVTIFPCFDTSGYLLHYIGESTSTEYALTKSLSLSLHKLTRVLCRFCRTDDSWHINTQCYTWSTTKHQHIILSCNLIGPHTHTSVSVLPFRISDSIYIY